MALPRTQHPNMTLARLLRQFYTLRRIAQPIPPRRQAFLIERINYRLIIDQVVMPRVFFFTLEDRSGLVRPEVDFNS